jgi:hypothetical protein
MSTFYEIIELSNGDVALARADDEKLEHLVTIRFSDESLAFLGEEKFNVAKAMIEAGMEAAGDVADNRLGDVGRDEKDGDESLEELAGSLILH